MVAGEDERSSSSSSGQDEAGARLQALSEIMVELEDRPMDTHLRRRQVDILKTLPMLDELFEAVNTLATMIMLTADEWESCMKKMSASPQSLESFLQTAECFHTAENDYISAELLTQHALFVSAAADGAAGDLKSELADFLTDEVVRGMLQDVYGRSIGLLAESQRIWTVMRDWEQGRLSGLQDEARDAQLAQLHTTYLERLRTPHIDLDTTASEYSTFCTHFCPDEYEKRMVEATATAQGAKSKLSSERRHGATREDFEQQLSMADLDGQLPLYMSYIAWEMDPKAKRAGAQSGPVFDIALTTAVFERTIAAYARAAQHSTDEQMGRLLKAGEGSIWNRYTNWARAEHSIEESLSVARRAVRACPGVPSAWCSLSIVMESVASSSEELETVFERAFALGFLTEGDSTEFMELFVTKASMQARSFRRDQQGEDAVHPVLTTASQGFELLDQVNKAGDASLRLEKFLLEWAETQSPEILQQALALVDKPLRSRTTSYQMTALRASIEARRGAMNTARQVYLAAIQRSDLDWPEAVYEAFARFEQVHGNVETIVQSQRRVEKEAEKLARRREKAAQAQAAQADHVTYSGAPAASDEARTAETPKQEPQIDSSREPQHSGKEPDNQIRRDREHTTVLIGGLAKTTHQDLVKSFFESCGELREVTILCDDAWPLNAALLEFKSADAVPAALAKDRRKLDSHEISVTMLWRSTLFITNFARDIDDAAIRRLFSHYGTILQTRWPSRKYADNRRFCYITMDSPSSAEAARVLDGFKPDGEAQFGMKVLISDPSAKAKRTDAQDFVVFIGGLNAKSTEQEVLDLFKGHGSVQSVKLGWDPVQRVCKGFAFVTMSSESDAQHALKLHGTSHKGRFLKVEPNDRNHANKKAVSDAAFKDKRARMVRLGNLPEGTQEALLQQALEKLVPVRRLEVFVKSRHALAELDSAADVGKLLLRSEPFEFEGAAIEISEHGRRVDAGRKSAAPETSKESASTPSSLSFAPRTTKRGGKVLGKGRSRPVTEAIASSAGSGGNPQDAFRAIVESKNKQREAKLETSRAKRRHEDGPLAEDQDEAKKYKPS